MVYNRIFILFCCVITFVLSSTAYAQTQKHNIMLGGNGSFMKRYRQNINPVNNLPQGRTHIIIHLNPTISYFVVDNLAFGLSVNYRSDKALDTEDGKKQSDGHSYAIGPTVRYYFPFDKWAIFPEAQLLKVSGKSHSYGLSDKLTNLNTGSAYKLGVGASYFITPNVGLEGLLSYSSENTMRSDNFYVDSPDVKIKRSGINLNIGIQFYLSMNK